MKITWAHNPLDTIVELDEHEVELFRLKLKLEAYEDMIFSAHHTLTTNEWYNRAIKPRTMEEAVAEAVKELDPEYWCTDEKSKLDIRLDTLVQHYLEELKSSHVGDCTCVAMSCSKCHAEMVLGIDTLKGAPWKHGLHAIASAFSHRDGETWKNRSLPEALAILKERHQQAYEYLLAYTAKHFPDHQVVPGDTEPAPTQS